MLYRQWITQYNFSTAIPRKPTGVCYQGREYYHHGDQWSDDPCSVCRCWAGVVECQGVTCLPPSEGCQAVTVEGQCCPDVLCQNGSGKYTELFRIWKIIILPTINILIRRRGHYNAWKLSTSSFPVCIEMLWLINKMSAKILNFLNRMTYCKQLKFWKCNQMSQ